ncbi:hypothetical protein SAMN05421890_1578 [Ensifer adhaerens]|nr:hypothetical protein SAMN05421890_1578 [Ensifer adhaerens]
MTYPVMTAADVAAAEPLYRKAQLLASAAARAKRNNAFTRGVMSSPPTVTANGTTNPLSASVNKSVLSNASVFTTAGSFYFSGGVYRLKTAKIGATGGNLGLNDGSQCSAGRISVMIDSTKVAFRVMPTTAKYRFLVNGQYVDMAGTQTAATTGNTHEYILLDFTSAGGKATREIAIEMQSACGLVGVYADAAGRIYPLPKSSAFLRGVAVGDSYIGGNTQMSALGNLYCLQMADHLGIDLMMASGSGGTKWAADNAGALSFGNRIAAGDIGLIGAAPDYVFLMASINDSASLGSAITANSAAAIQFIRNTYPNALIFCFGCYDPTGGSNATPYQASENAFFAGVDASGVTKGIAKIPITTDADGSWITSGNKADIIGADNTHMGDAGNATAGLWQANAVVRALASMTF